MKYGRRIERHASRSPAAVSGRAVLAGWILGASLALLAMGGSTATASTGSASSASIAWKPCGKQLQCARVPVPLDWARPGGRQIELALARHPASGPGKRIGSLFFNPGGPGNPAVPFIRQGGGELLDTYGRGRFDVVGWDIRGSAGASTAVRCFRDQRSRTRFWGRPSVPTTDRQSRAYRRKTAAFARRCGRRSGPLLRHISAADQARDLDHLRRLVGDRRLNYYGVSYGTFLGQTYANMFPDRVRAMVIDGVVDPVPYVRGAASAVAGNVVDSDRVLRRFAARCEAAGPGRCALAGQGPVEPRVDQLLARLRRGPLPAPTADPPGALSYADLQSALFSQLGHPDMWPQLAEWLDAAAEGDGSALATEGRKGYAAFRAAQNGDGFSALWCADSPAAQGSRAWPAVMRRLDAASRTRGTFLGWYAWGPCASWPTGSPDRYTGPWNATTENPVLVMGISADPNTPFRNARRVSRRLGNAVLLEHQGFGHGTYTDPSACVTRQMGAYLVDLRTPTRRVCPSDRDPFDPDFGLPLP